MQKTEIGIKNRKSSPAAAQSYCKEVRDLEHTFNCNTFAYTKALLLTAIGLDGESIKHIAEATGIKADTLYKWRSTKAHLSPEKADRLLLYFMQNEPNRLKMAEIINSVNTENNNI